MSECRKICICQPPKRGPLIAAYTSIVSTVINATVTVVYIIMLC